MLAWPSANTGTASTASSRITAVIFFIRNFPDDGDIPEEYMTADLWKLYELLEPYGQENEELKFSLRHAQIYEIYPSRGDSKVFRFAVKFGRNIWPALWWTPHNREEFSKGTFVNLVFFPDINYWKGQSKMQMVIEEMELS